jgi:hypothetical protein
MANIAESFFRAGNNIAIDALYVFDNVEAAAHVRNSLIDRANLIRSGPEGMTLISHRSVR